MITRVIRWDRAMPSASRARPRLADLAPRGACALYPYSRAPITAVFINHPGEHHSELIKWPRTRAMMSERPSGPPHLHRVGANARNRRAGMTELNVEDRPGRLLGLDLPRRQGELLGRDRVRLTALIDSNAIRVLELVMITRADDRSGEATEMREADDSEIGESRALERDRDPARRGGHQGDRRIACPRRGRRRSARGAPVRRRAAGERPNPSPGADRIGRSRPRSGVGRSMKMGPFRDRGDRPRLLGGGHERREEQHDGRGVRRDDCLDGRGDRPMIGATMVPDPDCCGDSSAPGRTDNSPSEGRTRRTRAHVHPASLQSLRGPITECDRCAVLHPRRCAGNLDQSP